MLEDLMQHDNPPPLQHVLERRRGCSADAEVGKRIDRLCRGLESLGVKQGDRVATFTWNTQRHLEAHFGVPAWAGSRTMASV
jgi:fatty-acyl-CoA synthase